MEVCGIANLGLKGVVGASGAEGFPGGGVLRVGVAGLHHELVDHAVEEHTVIIPFAGEFQEVVAVGRGVAEKAHLYVAL